MTEWLRIIDRGIAVRVEDTEALLFEPSAMCLRLAAALDPDEPDKEKLKLMNLCFDAMVCIREMDVRAGTNHERSRGE